MLLDRKEHATCDRRALLLLESSLMFYLLYCYFRYLDKIFLEFCNNNNEKFIFHLKCINSLRNCMEVYFRFQEKKRNFISIAISIIK